MRKIKALLGVLGVGLPLLLLLLTIPETPPPTLASASGQLGAEAVPGELVVGFQPGAFAAGSQALSLTVQPFGGRIVDQIPELFAVKVEVPVGSEQSVLGVIQALGGVDYVELNYQAEMLGEPNDDLWDEQWGPQKIEAPRAWDITKGSEDVLVAVIDSGLDYTHPDLKENYRSGGYDHIHDDNDPYPVGDGIGGDRGVAHGSHVAGIISAELDNRRGIAGLAQVPTIGIRVLDDEGRGSYWAVAKGIVHAAKAEARIINLSLGGPRSGKVLESAVNFAAGAGVLVIAAAGNSGRRGVSYPARYEAALAVSATDSNDRLAEFSSYGPEVELAAPGVKILSTLPRNEYGTKSGTSMAAPHVAGVAALVWAVNPKLTNEQVRKILCESADDLGPRGRDEKFGCGRVNASKAVQAARGEAPPPPPPPTTGELALEVDKGCGPAGTGYRVGETIRIEYQVGEEATVTVYRVGSATEEVERLETRMVAAASRQTLTVTAEQAGVETIVVQARTRRGPVLSRACTYSIGGVSLQKAQIWIDKGCDAAYAIGERITITIVLDEDGIVKLIDFASDGSVSTILEQQADAGETVTLSGQVIGPPGQDTLVVRGALASGLVVTNACGFTVTD